MFSSRLFTVFKILSLIYSINKGINNAGVTPSTLEPGTNTKSERSPEIHSYPISFDIFLCQELVTLITFVQPLSSMPSARPAENPDKLVEEYSYEGSWVKASESFQRISETRIFSGISNVVPNKPSRPASAVQPTTTSSNVKTIRRPRISRSSVWSTKSFQSPVIFVILFCLYSFSKTVIIYIVCSAGYSKLFYLYS